MTTFFELFYARIKKAANVSTDKGLSDFLGIKKSTLSMWKKREKVDYDLLFTKFEPLNIDIHWLIRGEEFSKSTSKPITDIRNNEVLENNLSKKLDYLHERMEVLECFMTAVKLKFEIDDEIEELNREQELEAKANLKQKTESNP